MTRMSKQGERRARSHKRPKVAGPKTGAKKDQLPRGFREHANAIEGDSASCCFIPKIQ